MESWVIEPVQPKDLAEFTQCQFKVFEEDILHNLIYPSVEEAKEEHFKALQGSPNLHTGLETYYRKVLDENGGIAAGLKYYLIGAKSACGVSPWDDKVPTAQPVSFAQVVKTEFLINRARKIKGPHARKPGVNCLSLP